MQSDVFRYFNPKWPIRVVGGAESLTTKDIMALIDATVPIGTDLERISVEQFFNCQDAECNFLVTVENPFYRDQALQHLEQTHLHSFSWVSPQALVWPTAEIKEGCIVWPFATVYSETRLSPYCSIGPYSGIGHRTVLGRNCLIQSNCQISGSASIGENCTIGSRSVVSPGIVLPANSQLAAYSALTKSPSEKGKFVGSPARKVG